MGGIVDGKCSECHLSGSAQIGYGMTPNGPIFWPIYCEGCKRVSQTDLLREPHACTFCGSRNISTIGTYQLTVWSPGFFDLTGEETIYEAVHACPKCGKQSLKFASFGLWD